MCLFMIALVLCCCMRALSSIRAQASHYGGFSCCRARPLVHGSSVMVHGLGCPTACGVVATCSGTQTHPEGQCRYGVQFITPTRPKAESPLSQGPRPVFLKTLYSLSVCAQTNLPKFPETSLNKGKERHKVNL